jgi:SAM-dependent methyltransferase
LRLNLGCGEKPLEGFVNVDFRKLPGVDVVTDLSKLPWNFRDSEAEQILMLDFLEHFPYRSTEKILEECWRILKPGGILEVQVPDLDHCGRATSLDGEFTCNKCGHWFSEREDNDDETPCSGCGQSMTDIALAASHRLMGGQDYEGNTHFACFSETLLRRLLKRNGFTDVRSVEKNENGESYFQNWNFKLTAVKGQLEW